MLRLTTLVGCLLLAIPAAAVEQAGEATKVLQTARAQGEGGTTARFLKAHEPIFTGDHITTDQRGQVQLRFVDDTRMVVGPNSQITIDQFVFESASSAKELVIDTVRGAFRFITGQSDAQAYVINFPGGTIGVRGTEFDISVTEDGTATLALYSGGLQVCDRSRPRRCTLIDRSCTVIVIPKSGEFKWVKNVYERTEVLDEDFPYAFRQRWLDRQFRINTDSCEIRDYLGAPSSDDAVSPAAPPPRVIN